MDRLSQTPSPEAPSRSGRSHSPWEIPSVSLPDSQGVNSGESERNHLAEINRLISTTHDRLTTDFQENIQGNRIVDRLITTLEQNQARGQDPRGTDSLIRITGLVTNLNVHLGNLCQSTDEQDTVMYHRLAAQVWRDIKDIAAMAASSESSMVRDPILQFLTEIGAANPNQRERQG